MRSFKNHFSVIVSFFVLLCSMECILFINQIVKSYEKNLVDDYSIIVISNNSLNKEKFIGDFSIVKDIVELDSGDILKNIEGNIPQKSIDILKGSMPNFYSIKLETFPSKQALKNLKTSLLKNSNITDVEVFSKTYDKIYKVLQLLHTVILFFTIIICFISILLIIKQMRIWLYEHKDRITIMTLFGASFWKKSLPLYKMVIVDAIISTFLTLALFTFLTKSSFLLELFVDIKINIPNFNILNNSLLLFCISFAVAIFSITYVILKVKNR